MRFHRQAAVRFKCHLITWLLEMDRMSKFVLPCYHSLFSCVVQARTKEAIIATDEHSTACGIERLGSPPWRTQWQRVNKNDHQLESSVMESIAEDGRRNRWVGNDNKKIRKRARQKRGESTGKIFSLSFSLNFLIFQIHYYVVFRWFFLSFLSFINMIVSIVS